MELNAESEEGDGPNNRSNDSMSDVTAGSNEAMEIDDVKDISDTTLTSEVTDATRDDVSKSSDLLENSECTLEKPTKKFTAKQYKKWLLLQSKIEKKYGKTNEGRQINISDESTASNEQSLNPRVVITRMTVDNITGKEDSSDTAQTDVVPTTSSDTTQTSVAAKSSDTTMMSVAAKSSDTTHTGVAAKNIDTTHVGHPEKSSDKSTTNDAAKSSDITMTDVAAKSSGTTQTGVAAKGSDTTMTGVAVKSSDTTQTDVTAKGSNTKITSVVMNISDTTQIDVSGTSETMQIDDEEKISETTHNTAAVEEAQGKFTTKHPQKLQEFQKVVEEKFADTHKDEQEDVVAGTSAPAEQCKALNPKVLIIPIDLTIIGKDKPVNISSSIKDKENNSHAEVKILSREGKVVETSHPGQREDTQLQETPQRRVINTSSVVVQSLCNTADENIDKPALHGVQKFLQLMNLLNKNPEKCKKWLQHQELQKQKLGVKYKEPIIYSTVKQISLSQIGMSKSNDERPVPKVQNSLDLLNILYLNPDKCTNWLIKQEGLRKQHGKKYQQPVIYSTVKLIAADHLKQANVKQSSIAKPISDNAKGTVHQHTNESNNTKVTTESPRDNFRIPKKNSVPEIIDTVTNVAEPSERDSNTEELTVPTEDQVFLLFPPNISFSKAFKTLGCHMDLRRKMSSAYKLPRYDYNGKRLPFGGSHSSKDIFKIPLKHSIRFKIIKCKPEMADNVLFDWMWKQLLQIESLSDMQLQKWEHKVTSADLTDYNIRHNADISSSTAGNALPPAENVIPPSETLNSTLFPCAPETDASSPAVPAGPVKRLSTHTGGFFAPVNSSLHLQPAPPVVLSTSPIGPPALGQTTSATVPPASAVDSPASLLDPQPPAAYPPPSAVGPSASTVGAPSPSATNTCAKTAMPPSTKPLDKTSKSKYTIPKICSNILLPSDNPTAPSTNTPAVKSNNTTKTNHSEELDFTHRSQYIAFSYKGKNVFYPKHVVTYRERKRFTSKEILFHKQKGNEYCPPEYDEKGVLIIRQQDKSKTTTSTKLEQSKTTTSTKLEQSKTTTSTKLEQSKTTASTIEASIKETSINKCILEAMESHLSQILLPTEVARINQLKNIKVEGITAFDKFGMRINPENITKSEPTKRSYEKSTSNSKYEKSTSNTTNEKSTSNKPGSTNKPKPPNKVSEVFSSDGKKIQPEKVKINVKLKKDEKPIQKTKEKSKSKSPTPVKKTSANNSSGSAHLSSHTISKYTFTPRLSGIPRDMASKWFEMHPSAASSVIQTGTQQETAAYSPVTYPGFSVAARQQPAPVNQPPAPVRHQPAPMRPPHAPVRLPPAPVRPPHAPVRPPHAPVRLPPAPVPAPKAPVRMPAMNPPRPVMAPQGFVPREHIAGALEPERGIGKGKLSAFERLGPPMEAKKPKLTINLMFTKDEKNEVIREVVEEHVPVYLRLDILSSRDVIVKEYLKVWPWARPVKILKESSHSSRDLLLDEYEMTACYNSKSSWIKVSVSRYPSNFKKEDVLDLLLKYVDKREFIPCFIEFKQEECIFLLNRSEEALTYLHKKGLVAEKDGVKLYLTVSQTNLTLDNLRFYKGAVFKAKLNNCYEANTNTLNLSAFQMQPDNSHFMYFPLNISYNQIFILNVVKAILPFNTITTLDLSGNRLKSMYFFNLAEHFPSLRVLNLSNNLLPTISTLACFKGIPLNSLYLEGNPLCVNFIQKDHYLEVVKLIFPRLQLLDGEKINSKIDIKRNFSVSSDAQELVNTFLEMFFTLTDSSDRLPMESLYAENAVFSITCRTEMKRKSMYHNLKEFYMWCRSLNESINPLDPLEGTIVGGPKIVRYFSKWPMVVHDPHTFTVDVMHHTENATILKVTGLFKIPAESLSQEEPIAEFSRTFILTTEDGTEYKIVNDMMYISDATQERLRSAFQVVTLQHINVDSLSLRFESAPDDELKDKFTEIIMQLSGMERKFSQRCLELTNWNLRKALEYFIRLEKLGNTGTLDF